MEQLVMLGVIVIFIGVAIVIIGSLLGAGGDGKGGAKIAVGGFIGPIPFGFANDKPLLYVVIAVAIIMVVLSVILSQKLM